jgi:hypothetical protein
VSSLTRQLSNDRLEPWRQRSQTTRGVRVRVSVWMRRGRLDRLLAAGVTPAESPELALRALQLTRARHRRGLADSLEEVVRIAQGEAGRRNTSPALASRDIRASRSALLQLAHVLRENRDVYASGVALAGRLLTDGTGPLYVTGLDDELWRATRDAIAALDGRIPQASAV